MSDSTIRIYPRCKIDMKETYVSAEGYVYPCCWLGNLPFADSYKSFHGDQLFRLDANQRELEEILEDPQFKKLEESWPNPTENIPCIHFCAKPPPESQQTWNGSNREIVTPLGFLD